MTDLLAWMDLNTALRLFGVGCFICVGLFMWAVHYGPLSTRD